MTDLDGTIEGLAEPSTLTGRPGADTTKMLARTSQAISYRLAGMTYAQIAEACGYTEAAQARNVIVKAMKETVVDQVEVLRELENQRLDRQLAAIWTQVLAGDIQAGSLALRISERRAKLNNLDQARSDSPVDPSELRAWVQQVMAAANSGPVVSEPDLLRVIEGEVVGEQSG